MAPDLRPLEESLETDVCIIGAGYTGLSTAPHLTRDGIRVVVLRLFRSYFSWRDNRAARRDGTELPPHAN
jgi:glycine/D-amino acid oxidase-like deaminating enzyme